MSTIPSESDFLREFEEFQHKKAAATRLTWSALQDETEQVLRVAWFPFAHKGRSSERPENTDEIMWIKDADDPQRWRPIKGRKIAHQQGSPKNRKQATERAKARGENQQLMIALGLDYYLFDVLLARMIPHVRRLWKEVAALTRRYSSSDSLLAQVHLAPEQITANQHRLSSLCEFWDRPKLAAEFKVRFREVFVREFEKLRSEAELESEPQLTAIQESSSGKWTADQGTATRTRRPTGQIGVPTALYSLLSGVKGENPGLRGTCDFLSAGDKKIANIKAEAERKRHYRAVHDAVPKGWKDRIGEQRTLVDYWNKSNQKERGRIKTYVSGVKVPERGSSNSRQLAN